jgi:hypothetical protein
MPAVVAPSRRRPSVAVGVVALVAVIGAGTVAAGIRGNDRPQAAAVRTDQRAGDPAPERPVPAHATATTLRRTTPVQAFAGAAARLGGAGSFTYRGTASATDVSHVRPSLWLAVDVAIEGEVMVPTGRVHEIALEAGGRAVETVTDGPTVWGRSAPSRDALADRDYRSIPELSDATLPAKGAALLPHWLGTTTGPTDAGVDTLGRRTFRATIPAAVLGEIERGRRAVDADIVLTLDAADEPVRVEITSAPSGPPLHLVLDIFGMGEPVNIAPPFDG